jgi:outer membrane protein TolC
MLMTFIILIVIFSINSAAAEEISLTEVLERGLNNNLEIREEKNKIASLERELKTIRAQQGWQVEVSANYNELVDEGDLMDNAGALSDTNNTRNSSGGNTSLNINRRFDSGLSISQEAVYNDQEESDYGVIISYPLFNGVPTESERSYYQKEQELLKAKNSLNSLIEDKISSWVENHLQLLRLEQSRENAELQYQIAKKTLSEKEELYQKQQISESEFNNSKAEILDAENNYLELKNQYQNLLKSFKLELDLSKDVEIKIEHSKYLEQLKNELHTYKNYNQEELARAVLKSDYGLQSALINLTLQEKQLEWFQNEGRADINLSGSYNYSTERSVVGVTFSYDLFDGGQREYNEKNLKENLKLAQSNLEKLKENKIIALERQLNTVDSAENSKKSAELKLENAKRQFDLAQAQAESGLISPKDLKEQQLVFEQSKNNYQQTVDKLYIAELDLTMMFKNNFKEIYYEVLNDDQKN